MKQILILTISSTARIILIIGSSPADVFNEYCEWPIAEYTAMLVGLNCCHVILAPPTFETWTDLHRMPAHLIPERKISERRQTLRPPDGHEEQPGGALVDRFLPWPGWTDGQLVWVDE